MEIVIALVVVTLQINKFKNYIMKKENWILLPIKEFLPNGKYLFKCKHPKSKKESEVMHEVTNGLHGFAYAYKCRLISTTED